MTGAWHPMTERPPSGSRIAAIYSDGSGGRLFLVHDAGLVDAEGDAEDWEELVEHCRFWATLPDGYELFFEDAF